MKTLLTNFEQAVLEAIIALRADAYGVPVRKRVSEKFNRDISVGQLYSTLDRLEQQGFIESNEGGETNSRGRKKRYYKICSEGIKALNNYREFMNKNIDELTASLNGLIT